MQYFFFFLCFFSLFFAFLLFSAFLHSPRGQRKTTAIYCKNGEFHSDPVCTDPVQNFLNFQNFIVMAFPKQSSVLGRFSSLPPIPPLKKANFVFIVISPSLTIAMQNCFVLPRKVLAISGVRDGHHNHKDRKTLTAVIVL